jgi:hypothetical protein
MSDAGRSFNAMIRTVLLTNQEISNAGFFPEHIAGMRFRGSL